MIVSTRQEGKCFFWARVPRSNMPRSLDDLIEKSRWHEAAIIAIARDRFS
jgi:hypothetical protein